MQNNDSKRCLIIMRYFPIFLKKLIKDHHNISSLLLFELDQVDVKIIFLNKDLNKKIYME